MATVFVTGASGLIGSNVCEAVVAAGHRAHALVRRGSAPETTDALTDLGAELRWGDLTSADDVLRASDGCDACIHTAALVVGGPPRPWSDFVAVNVDGTRHVLDAAEHHGFDRTVCLSTSASFERTTTLTEDVVPLRDRGRDDPYAATKLLAWEDVVQRVAAGLDAVTVLPGGYGPAPTLRRAIEPPGLNDRIIRALGGALDTFPPMRSAPVLASDVAVGCVAALDRGVAGETYLLTGRPEDVVDAAEVLNRAIAVAGRPHHVRPLSPEEMRSDEVLARWGPSVVRATLEQPEPPFSNVFTVERLGYDPTPLDAAIERTVSWMLEHGFA